MAVNKYEDSKVVVKNLKLTNESNPNSEILVPITGSLYIPGKQINTDKLMIDYGTGYFVERNYDQTS